MEQLLQQVMNKLDNMDAKISTLSNKIAQIETQIPTKRETAEHISWKSKTISEKIAKYGKEEKKPITWVSSQKLKPQNIAERYTDNLVQTLTYLAEKHPKIEELYSLTGYNKLVADKNTDQQLVLTAYNYGLLQVLYIENLSQLELFDKEIRIAYQKFQQITKADLIYMRIYSAMAEPYENKVIPKIELIKFGITYTKLQYDEVYEQESLRDTNIKEFIHHKRALGILIIQRELENTNNQIWLYSNNDGRLIYSISRTTNEDVKNIVADWSQKLNMPEGVFPKCSIKNPMMTMKTMEILCDIARRQIYTKHKCNLCTKMKDVKISDPVFPTAQFPTEQTDNNDDIMHDEEDKTKATHED
ncbi:putative inclusion body protein [Epiphyllum virus 4]|uniref:Putative inclusion body protein n=1 Tax=Epiphyllum virus 4 TaxID=2713640 RepID=A0A6G6CZ15_9VIRU|nr:putative inclusion body protein [Epiphyllum virus 4]QIE08171.1 putative inclusion body protein [Epiphyllum virus 4]